jgi:HSP20 family molecular chaperone IbpA
MTSQFYPDTNIDDLGSLLQIDFFGFCQMSPPVDHQRSSDINPSRISTHTKSFTNSNSAYDIYETKNNYKIVFAAPGIFSDKIKMKIKKVNGATNLVITSENSSVHTHLSSVINSSYNETFCIPYDVIDEDVSFTCKNGIIYIIIQKPDDLDALNFSIQ